MANRAFNISKGKSRYYVEQAIANAGTIGMLVLRLAEAEATLEDRTTLTDILGHNTEVTDGWYARQTLSGLTIIQDDTLNKVDLDGNDAQFTTTNTGTLTAKAVFYFKPTGGNDGNSIPLSFGDLIFTANGQVENIGIADFVEITD